MNIDIKSLLILGLAGFVIKRSLSGPQPYLARASLAFLLAGMVAILVGAPDRESPLVLYVGGPLFLVGIAMAILLLGLGISQTWLISGKSDKA